MAALGMCPIAKGHRFRDSRRGKTANLTTQQGQGTESILRNFRERQNLYGNAFVCRLVGQVTAGSEHQRSIFTHEICSIPSVPSALPARPAAALPGSRLSGEKGQTWGLDTSLLGHETPIYLYRGTGSEGLPTARTPWYLL